MQIQKNEDIKQKKIYLVDAMGAMLGEFKTSEALDMAKKEKLDIVVVSESNEKTICKMVNYDKYRYQMKKSEKIKKKNCLSIEPKELQLRPNIAEHDFQVKAEHGRKFLRKGNKVRVVMRVRGRESAHMDVHSQLLDRFLLELTEEGSLASKSKINGNNIVAVVNPK